MVLLNGILRELDIGAYKMVEQIPSVCAALQAVGNPFFAEILDTLNGTVLTRERNQGW